MCCALLVRNSRPTKSHPHSLEVVHLPSARKFQEKFGSCVGTKYRIFFMKQFLYQRRDTSWLSFNHRVLQEAADPRVPLYERLKFLAIYSSNLDEFYRVRVSTLRRFKEMKKAERKALTDIKPQKELKEIKRLVHQQQTEFGKIFRSEILPALRKEQIYLLNSTTQFDKQQKAFAKSYFQEKVLPLINRQYLQVDGVVPFLKNRALYLLVKLDQSPKLGLVNIPSESLPRFLILPGPDEKLYVAFLDDIIRINLNRIFEEPIKAVHSVKVSRDAELYIDDEYGGDLLEKIKANLGGRDTGLPTRLLYDSNLSMELVNDLKNILQLKKNDLFPGGRYHNFSDFFSFPRPAQKPHLQNKDLPPLNHPKLEGASSLISCIQREDQVLHFPYQKYDYIIQLLQEAGHHPEVEKIKITLYRVAENSAIVKALIEAIRLGKQVTVFIEAKARFDEASNIYWGKELEEAGADVLYSYPNIKVHCKVLSIQFSSRSQLKSLCYLGTGNFNEKTATLYGDHALLTADKRLNRDVNQVFGLLERKIVMPDTQKMLLSPFSARAGFESLINQEITNAKSGKTASILLKMNSLEDLAMIKRLYQANNAGVDITLIVRGICCLVPGIKGQSERIKVYSLVDRFLEHARVYLFNNGGKELMYLASADWMTRNLDRRIELVFPIKRGPVFDQLRHIIDLQLRDNTKLRLITPDLDNPYVQKAEQAEPFNAQTAIYTYLSAALPNETKNESDS